MYLPEHFAEHRVEELHRLIRTFPLGALVATTAKGLDANHLPFELDADRGVLTCHVARANRLWQDCPSGSEVLVIFRGPDAYVSPNWYPGKHIHHRAVPTWNYQVVHAHGCMVVRDDERFVRGLVARLTRMHEANEPKPWKMGDAPADYIDTMVQAIVGIEIEITRLEGKAKLSQNREAADREGVRDALQARGQMAIAEAMEKTRRH